MEIMLLVLVMLFLAIHYPRKDDPARIKWRSGGTPVVDATFNGDEQYEMVVDTGASKSVISQGMAKALNVKPEGTQKFIMASGKVEEFAVGRVDSIEVAGAKAENLKVAIIPGKDTVGLLGQDVFGDCEVLIKRDEVQFNKQSK